MNDLPLTIEIVRNDVKAFVVTAIQGNKREPVAYVFEIKDVAKNLRWIADKIEESKINEIFNED